MTKEQMNAAIPRDAQWAAENYNHLMVRSLCLGLADIVRAHILTVRMW